MTFSFFFSREASMGLRMSSPIGTTRTVIRPLYALLAPDGRVNSVLPGWNGCTVWIQISSAIGAGFCQILIDLPKGAAGQGNLWGLEWCIYVVSGQVLVNKEKLSEGHYAFLPPGSDYAIRGVGKNSRILIFQKRYEPIAEVNAPCALFGDASKIEGTPFLGDPNLRIRQLLPDTLEFDLAVNISTYDPGATLPFVETHIMEHGLLMLEGAGVYRLSDDWYPVQTGDAIWMAAYCPQWFVATGKTPASYAYHKDVNRSPL